MNTVTKIALFAAGSALGLLSAASAAPIIVTTDTTISSNATGDDGATGLDDAGGFIGGAAVIWDNVDVDVTILPGWIFTGGLGGLGGPDAANDGGNQGGTGGAGFLMQESGGTVAGNGISVYGGAGGAGSDGSASGANDTVGGNGGTGGYGIQAFNDALQVTLTTSVVAGGNGGNGGAAGDSAGDAGDDASGGAGGLYTQGAGNIINIQGVGSTIFGGDGGNGGASLAGATNANGGDGGEGIYDAGTDTVITIGVGALVRGGFGGSAGTGGTGGAQGADASGVWLQGVAASLTNNGTIWGSTAQSAAAVAVIGDTALLDNFGTIGGTSDHAGRGILVSSAVLTTLRNRPGALIQSSGIWDTIDISPVGEVGTFLNEGSIINSGSGVAVRIYGGVGAFTNAGTIQANSSGALLIGGGIAFPDMIDNTGGLITNASASQAAITLLDDLGAAGLTLKGGQISNTGGYPAIRVFGGQSGNIVIDQATIGGGVLFQSNDETLNVLGSVLDGDIAFDGGTNNLNFAGGATTIASATQFSSAGSMFFSVLAGGDVISNAEQTDANSSVTDMILAATANLTLNESFFVDETVFNQGTITIAAGKTLTGNAFSGAGIYVFGIADAATVGKVVASGAGSSIDFSGASLQVALDNPSNSFVAGAQFLIAEALSGSAILGVVDGTLLADNSALLTLTLYRGDAAHIGLTSDLLFAEVSQLLLADIASHGDDPNAIALGAALDIIGLDGNAPLDNLMLDLALLATDAEINAVLDSLLPETDGVAYDIATDAGDQILDVASRRLDGLRGTSVASLEYKVAGVGNAGLRGGLDRKGVEIWGQGFGRIVEQRRHDYNDGYDADGFGFAAGVDTPFDGGKSMIGGAFAYGRTSAESNTINRTETDVDSSQIVVYGDHLFDDRTYAKGMLGYGWHENDIARHHVGGPLGPTVTASYDAWQFTARAETGHPYKSGANLTLVPHLTANYAYYDPDDYRETDPSAGDAIPAIGGLGLYVRPESLQSFRLGLGLLARWDVELDADVLFQPELRLNYRRELIGDRFETTSEFIGAPGLASFNTQGVDPAPDIVDLGIGALLATAAGIDLRASYDLELKDDYTAHGGYVRASVAF